MTNSAVILFIMEADNELFTGIDANCSGWIDKITKRTEKDNKEKKEEDGEEKAEEEQEKKEEEEEGKVPEDQDMDGSPVALRIKNTELKARVEILEARLESLCSKVQTDKEQDSKKMETLSNAIVRMEFEMKIPK